MNTASEDLPHHLGVLCQKLQHHTDYKLAENYFLEEFAGDARFVGQSEPEEGLHLRGLLAKAAAQALGKTQAPLDQFKAFRVPNHSLNHGNGLSPGACSCFSFSSRRIPG